MANDILKPVYVDNNDNPPQQNVTRLENQYTEEEFNTMINSIDSAINELQDDAYARNWGRNESTSGITAQTNFFGKYEDYGQTMQDFAVHDPYGDPNMFIDRYQAFGDLYDKLGFSPYRNNEALYNANASDWDKWKKSIKAFGHLTWISLQQNSIIGSGVTDNDRTKELANQYNYWNTIGMDSGEGIGAFARNLLVTYGSTAAVMLKMAVEEIAINVGITALTGGTGTAGTMAATSARFAKFGNFMNKVREGLKSANVIRKAYKQAGGWKRFGYAFSEFIAPGTWSGIARGVHNIKKGRTLEGSLNMLHGMYSTARAYKVTQSEALLEANLSAQEYVMEMYNSGKQFTDEQVEMIKRSAEAISNEVFWKNIPAIYLSNLVIFNDLLSPVAGRFVSKAFKGPNKLFGKLPQRLSHGKWYNQIYRVGKEDKRLWDYGIKSIPIALGYWIPKGGKMFAVGSVEGIQENIQDIINYSAKKYYHDMYLDNDRFHEILGSTVDVSGFGDAFRTDHLFGYSEAYQQQFTKQGWETFLTGTLMGGPTALLSASGKGLWKAGQFAVDKTKLNKLKKERDKATLDSQQYKILDKEYKAKEKAFNYKYDVDNIRSDEWLEVYDFVFNKPTDFFNKNLENMVNINSTTSETQEELKFFDELIANAPNETSKQILQSQRERAEERAKIRQWNMIFRQLCSSGEIDLVKSELERLKNEDDDVLSGLNNGNGSEDIKKRIDDCIKIIDQTQTVYDGLVKKFDNPQDMKAFLKKYGCKTEEEFVSKYGKNEDLMQLYHNEQMLGEAYNRAIDEMVYYANEYESAVKDKETLLDIFEKTLTKTNELLDNGLIPKGSSLTDVTSLYTEQSMQDLIDSNNVLIQSMKSQLEGTEDEKERNGINKKIEDLEYKNHQLGIIINALHEQKLDDTGNVVKDSEGKVVKITADEFNDTISEALKKYFKSVLQADYVTYTDTLANTLSEYFESYRNSKKLYDILQTITNPRNFNAIIESRNEILMDIYNQRYNILQNSIAQYKKDSITNDIINKLYKEGYAVDNNFIARLLGKTSNKAGKIYKISDKNFNKEEVITSERPVTVYKYKDIDEAFKNSFDVVIHPLSKEYHDVLNKIIEIMKANPQHGIVIERLINIANNKRKNVSVGNNVEVKDVNDKNIEDEKTIEQIEHKYLDNNAPDKLFTFIDDVQFDLNDLLAKIKLSEDNKTFKELIKALQVFNKSLGIKVVFGTLDDTEFMFKGKTLVIDPRYWDSRYKSNNVGMSFALGLITANLGMVIATYSYTNRGNKNLKEFTNAFSFGDDAIRNMANFLVGVNTGIKAEDVNINKDNLTTNVNQTGFIRESLDLLLNQLGLAKDSELYDAIMNTIGTYGAFSSTGTREEARKQGNASPRRTSDSGMVIKNNNADIDVASIDLDFSQLSPKQKLLVLLNKNSANVQSWLKKHENDNDYKDALGQIAKREKTWKDAFDKGESSNEYTEVRESLNIGKVTQSYHINYVYGFLGITQTNIDEINNMKIDSVTEDEDTETEPTTFNQATTFEQAVSNYSKGLNVEFHPENHTYTVDGVQADTSATGIISKILGEEDNDDDNKKGTIKGLILDAALRAYYKTGNVNDASNEIDEILNLTDKDGNRLVDELTDSQKDQMMKSLQDIAEKSKKLLFDKLGWKEEDIELTTTESPFVVHVSLDADIDGQKTKHEYSVGMTTDMVAVNKKTGKSVVIDFKTISPGKGVPKDKYNLQTLFYEKGIDAIVEGNDKLDKVTDRLLIKVVATNQINENTYSDNNIEVIDFKEYSNNDAVVSVGTDKQLKITNLVVSKITKEKQETPTKNDDQIVEEFGERYSSEKYPTNQSIKELFDEIIGNGSNISQDRLKELVLKFLNDKGKVNVESVKRNGGNYLYLNDKNVFVVATYEQGFLKIDGELIYNGTDEYKKVISNLIGIAYQNLVNEVFGTINPPAQTNGTSSTITDILNETTIGNESVDELLKALKDLCK